MKNKLFTIITIVLLAAVVAGAMFVYTVKEGQQVVVTQFGQVKRTVKNAGLHFKMPFIEKVNVFEKRLLEWDGNPTQVPTYDKRYIMVDSFARWKIEDPLKYFKTVSNERSAHNRLDGIIDGAVRNQISSNPLIKAVRSSDREMQTVVSIDEERLGSVQTIGSGRDGILKKILAEVKPAANSLGIEIVDIRIKRINYVERVRKSAYERMIAERQQIAAKYRSEGEGRMMEIEGQKEEDEKKILSEAYKQAQEIMGKADGEAVKIYAESYTQDPEFYSFLKTLESYENNLGKSSTIILSTESDYLKYLKSTKSSTP